MPSWYDGIADKYGIGNRFHLAGVLNEVLLPEEIRDCKINKFKAKRCDKSAIRWPKFNVRSEITVIPFTFIIFIR